MTEQHDKIKQRLMGTIKLPLKNREGKVIGHAPYAKVATRVKQFHEDNPSCSISTEVNFKEGWAIVTAVVSCDRGTYSGHAMSKVSSDKSLEKLETVAVGRALAFAGYLAGGEIASFEEMESYRSSQSTLNDLVGRPRMNPTFVQSVNEALDNGSALEEILALAKTDEEKQWATQTWTEYNN